LEGERQDVIVLESSSTRIIGVYRGFKNFNPNRDPLDYLFNTLSATCDTAKDVVIVGDFNIDPIRDLATPAGQRLLSLTVDKSLHQLVNANTRFRVVNRNGALTLEESRIDLVLSTNDSVRVEVRSQYNSDHCLIEAETHELSIPKTEKIVIRDWSKMTEQNMVYFWDNVPMTYQLDLSDLNVILQSMFHHLAPERVVRTRSDVDLVNPKIEKVKKRRDRLLKKIKKTLDGEYKCTLLNRLKDLNKQVTKIINKETKRIFQKKAESPNGKCFWDLVNRLQGKKTRNEFSLNINGKLEKDKLTLANAVASFFEGKILNLTKNLPPIDCSMRSDPLTPLVFSNDEICKALDQCKPKMSKGVDDIPMKAIKIIGKRSPSIIAHIFSHIFSHIASSGFPAEWKLARVVPVPKKGDPLEIKNYRPVSNLCSLSKVYERCILNKLMDLGNIDRLIGIHQHGFRKYHSTVTCALELRDKILEHVDDEEHVFVYSLDLTAAFDMLRPDTFSDMLKDEIPSPLMWALLDFLSDRQFFVDIGGVRSEIKKIDRGCPQGSVLGPILFNLYVRKCMETLPSSVDYFSYADDLYVVIHDTNINRAVAVLEEVIASHVEHLTEVGMVVNKAKTEVIQFFPTTDERVQHVNVCGEKVPVVEHIKVLGLTFDNKLCWKQHIDNIKKKLTTANNGVKLIRRKMDAKQSLLVVTAQALSVLYYGSPVWLTPGLSKSRLKVVESLHYRCVRLVVKDYKQRVSRDVIDSATKRLPPLGWMNYAMCNLYINSRMSTQPKRLLESMEKNLYNKRRQPGLVFGFDNSKSCKSKQCSKNWLGDALSKITTPWSGLMLSRDQIRTMLKRHFYPTMC